MSDSVFFIPPFDQGHKGEMRTVDSNIKINVPDVESFRKSQRQITHDLDALRYSLDAIRRPSPFLSLLPDVGHDLEDKGCEVLGKLPGFFTGPRPYNENLFIGLIERGFSRNQECRYGGYERCAVPRGSAYWRLESRGSGADRNLIVVNDRMINFPKCTSGSSEIVAAAIYEAKIGGEPLCIIPLTGTYGGSIRVGPGMLLAFAENQLELPEGVGV